MTGVTYHPVVVTWLGGGVAVRVVVAAAVVVCPVQRHIRCGGRENDQVERHANPGRLEVHIISHARVTILVGRGGGGGGVFVTGGAPVVKVGMCVCVSYDLIGSIPSRG